MNAMAQLSWELGDLADESLADNHGIELPPFDLQLLFANRIIDESWRQRKAHWTRVEIGDLLFDTLYELDLDWDRSTLLENLKAHLGTAFKAARAVLPEVQRDF